MFSSMMRAGCIAAAMAIASPAAADVVIYQATGQQAYDIIPNLALTAGVFDVYLETSELVNFEITARADTELAIRPVSPPSPLVDYGSAGYLKGVTGSGYSAFFQFEIPQDTYSTFVAGSQYTSYGIQPGTLMSSTFSYLNPRLQVLASIGGPPYLYDYTVKVVRHDAVPEPSTWALMILGFGSVGLGLRTRRRALAPAISS